MTQIGHYRIESEIGRGGMGVVYHATDTKLGRAVAVKVLPQDATTDPERQRRFIREAQSASALNHPNIVTIYEIGEDAGTTFIAMELVDGTPLDQLVGRGPLSVATAVDYGAQIARALGVAHSRGIIHRDIKPANIIVSPDGRVKVLDFGLAKLVERTATEATITAVETQPGVVMGTAAYMSPEQAEGRHVDARSDIFSAGAVLYELLAGRRPFTGSTHLGVITSILRDEPRPVRELRPDVPADLQAVVSRALAKDPALRYADAGALAAELSTIHDRLTRPRETAWRRPAVLVPIVFALVAAAGYGTWQALQSREAQHVRREVIPEIERLQFGDRSIEAVRLVRGAARVAPDEVRRIIAGWFAFDTTTNPEGASIEIRNYVDANARWEPIGTTPVQGVKVPLAMYRIRVSKAGFVPMDLAFSPGAPTIRLVPESAAQPGMVLVEGGPFSIGVTAPVQLPDFWIDKYELTNGEYKRFVDAGGYRDPKYWKEPFQDAGRTLAFDEAMARFNDKTGRPGPATWELGSHADGQQDYPVSGISWYEASAYAVFAGKQLPTFYHWYRAAGSGDDIFSDVLRVSNFDGNGPSRAGDRQGVVFSGAFDMAGNVKEWCANATGENGMRYILGGGWNEPPYRFRESEARNPWSREPTFGVRLVRNDGPLEAAASAPVPTIYPDPASIVPVPDATFDIYRSFYTYDRTPLNARPEKVDDSSPYWRKEKVSYDAAYGGERIPAYLFLPKNVPPPYQTVIFFPSSYARDVTSSEFLDMSSIEFIIRSGRALLYPVYQGTFERRRPIASGNTSAIRDRNIEWAKDFFRSVDYLAERKEIDMNRLGYYSLSLGAFFGPIPVSLDSRIKVAVFAAGGLRFNLPGEVLTTNFMPRVKVPVLLVNGRDDFSVPPDAQRKFLELLGTRAEDKKLVQLEGGHVPNDMHAFFREILNWYDKYLGRVR